MKLDLQPKEDEDEKGWNHSDYIGGCNDQKHSKGNIPVNESELCCRAFEAIDECQDRKCDKTDGYDSREETLGRLHCH